MHEVSLPGCTPEPLMGYLKALGVFRLVAEQADPSATLCWKGGIACLTSKLDRDGLVAFFRDEYQPTPVLAPWNGGSGFYDGGTEPLKAIERSTTERLRIYREAIASIRRFVPKNKPKDDEKDDLLIRCRAELSDEVVPWLDVCFVLGESQDRPGQTRPSFFPLLGTGGNDGRLDFTNNFFQRLAGILPFANEELPKESAAWLNDSLFADVNTALKDVAIGQFNPGGIGGANGVQGNFEAGSRVNPWDYILMIEGSLLFAGSVARRLGANATAKAAFPFSVESVAVGYGSSTASEETTDGSRAELWLPLWNTATSLGEVRQLFAEGRAQLGRRQARNAVEFALAVNLLGVSKGIEAFSRYGFLKRNGLAFLAAPLGRVAVTLRPKARLLDDPALVAWLDQLRRACREKDKTPARYQTALRNIDRAMFAFANRSEHGNDAKYLVDVLVALGQAERTLASGLRFAQEKYIRPLAGLSAQWLDAADDGSVVEFRLAAALAGVESSKKGEVGALRAYLEEVEVKKFVNWSSGSKSAVWSKQPLAANLAAVFRRRQMEAFRGGVKGVPMSSPRPARLDDVLTFLHGKTDDEKLGDLIWALTAINWRKVTWVKPERSHGSVPFEFGLPRLLVNPLCFQAKPIGDTPRWVIDKGEANAVHDPDVFHALATRDIDGAITKAARRLRSGGLTVNGYRNRRQAGGPLTVETAIDPERLLAAMLIPLSPRDLVRIANTILYPPEPQGVAHA